VKLCTPNCLNSLNCTPRLNYRCSRAVRNSCHLRSQLLFVVHYQQLHASLLVSVLYPTRGSVTANRAPGSPGFSSLTFPPCWLTISRTIARPSPLPPLVRVVTSGSKIRSDSAKLTPGPESLTTIRTLPSIVTCVVTSTRHPSCAGGRSRTASWAFSISWVTA